jgi:hypothetical protein
MIYESLKITLGSNDVLGFWDFEISTLPLPLLRLPLLSGPGLGGLGTTFSNGFNALRFPSLTPKELWTLS